MADETAVLSVKRAVFSEVASLVPVAAFEALSVSQCGVIGALIQVDPVGVRRRLLMGLFSVG